MKNTIHLVEAVVSSPEVVLTDMINRVVHEHSKGKSYSEDNSTKYYQALAITTQTTLLSKIVSDIGFVKESFING
jgi:hypothetical protein